MGVGSEDDAPDRGAATAEAEVVADVAGFSLDEWDCGVQAAIAALNRRTNARGQRQIANIGAIVSPSAPHCRRRRVGWAILYQCVILTNRNKASLPLKTKATNGRHCDAWNLVEHSFTRNACNGCGIVIRQVEVSRHATQLTQKSSGHLHLPVDATLQLTMLRAHAGLFDDQQTQPFL